MLKTNHYIDYIPEVIVIMTHLHTVDIHRQTKTKNTVSSPRYHRRAGPEQS